jgi:hypothetical protein
MAKPRAAPVSDNTTTSQIRCRLCGRLGRSQSCSWCRLRLSPSVR